MELHQDHEPPYSNGALRGARRRAYQARVVVWLDRDSALTLPSRDLSANGVFLQTPVCCDEGTPVVCSIPLPTGVVLRAHGRVVRVVLDSADPRASGMGVAFERLSEEERHEVARALETQRD